MMGGYSRLKIQVEFFGLLREVRLAESDKQDRVVVSMDYCYRQLEN